jgi:HK97 family phage major capsid protein
MPSQLIQKLGADYEVLINNYEGILNRCSAEGRDPNAYEVGVIDDLRSQMSPLSDRIIELRQTEDAKSQTLRAMSDGPSIDDHGFLRLRSEPEVYRPPDASSHERHSFFRDLLTSQMAGDVEARSRLDRHNMQMRAAGTSTTGTGVIPPTWLFNEFAIIAHGARPWADTLRRVGITDANPVNVGVQSAGAAVTIQASENTAPNDGSFGTTILTTTPHTVTGKVDVSRQLLDGSNPAVDGLVFTDCMGSYNEQIETMVVSAFTNATGFAATITYPGTAPVYATLPDAFIDAGASVVKHRKMPARVVFCSTGAWAYLLHEKDSQGRPLITTGAPDNTAVNALGLGSAMEYGQVAGQVTGLAVVPSWAGVDNSLYVAKADDLLLLESSTFNFRYEEVLGPETIRLGVWGYAAPVIARYPVAIAKIDAGTTIPAPQSDVEEVAQEHPESGPGAMRTKR